MKKLGMVLGVAAVATLAGCKDPNYKGSAAHASRNEVKQVESDVRPAPVKKLCTCAPGTRHTSPCLCGADNCACVVVKPAPAVKPAEPEYTLYIVQRGDYLAKISKKYNIRVDAIRELNPSIKKDVIRIGQKIKLPGKVNVGKQEMPKFSSPAKKPAKKAYVSYTGATKEYVVKSGDTLGSIAYGNGINIRQLKNLNGLKNDNLRIGQKLKIPSDKVVAASPKAAKPVAAEKESAPVKKAEPAPLPEVKEETPPAAPAALPAETESPAADPVADSVPAAAEQAAETQPTSTYVIQEGDDMTGVAIRFGVTAATIRDLNNLPEEAQLVPGQVIKLPADAQQ